MNLDLGTCTCNEWKATGIPCGHALAVIMRREENPQTYGKEFLSLEFYHNIILKLSLYMSFIQS